MIFAWNHMASGCVIYFWGANGKQKTPNAKFYAADSDRNILWNLGPVNCTPTSFPPAASATCTTRPLVEKSGSAVARRAAIWYDRGMRISRSLRIATSNRVRNAAPPRHKFSQEVSSVKTTPRLSRPVTCIGRRTAILRSERCFDAIVLTWTMGRVLSRSFPWVGCFLGGGLPLRSLKEAFDRFQHFVWRPCRVYSFAKFAAVPHTVREPACKLLHFSHSIGLIGCIYLSVVARK